MCFRFGSCFGSGTGQDHGRWIQPDHSGYNGGVDHKSGPPAYHLQPVADEAPRNGNYNDGGAPKDHLGDDDGHGGHATHAQDKADDEAPKHPAAWSSKVGNVDAGHNYKVGLQEDAAADPTQNAAADYHSYQTTTTAILAR
ncbi:unnamed protein product [Alopecurus aequalis]